MNERNDAIARLVEDIDKNSLSLGNFSAVLVTHCEGQSWYIRQGDDEINDRWVADGDSQKIRQDVKRALAEAVYESITLNLSAEEPQYPQHHI